MADEQRFLISLKDAQETVNKLGLTATKEDLSRATAKLIALTKDAPTYLEGRKKEAVTAQALQALSLWNYLTKTGESTATKKRRIMRYLTTIQTILTLPESQVPSPTAEEKPKVDAVISKVERENGGRGKRPGGGRRGARGEEGKIFGIPTKYAIGGAVGIAAIAYYLRKKK